jgi:hypothetical protein
VVPRLDYLVAPAENSNVVTLRNTDVPCAYVGTHPSPVVSLIGRGFVPFEAVSRDFTIGAAEEDYQSI